MPTLPYAYCFLNGHATHQRWAPELLVMRRRLMKTHQSMKHRGVSPFSRVYWYLEVEEIGKQLIYPFWRFQQNWTENVDCTNVFSLFFIALDWIFYPNGRSESCSCFYSTSCKQLRARLVGCMVVGRLICMKKIPFFMGCQTRGVSPRWPACTLKHLWTVPRGNIGIECFSRTRSGAHHEAERCSCF
jgi:hypothetical protein